MTPGRQNSSRAFALRWGVQLACLLALSSNMGCHLFRRRPTLEPTPIVFQQPPQALEQICAAVNANTTQVMSLQSRDARLSLRGLPGISVDIAFEQPRRFRFRAGTSLTGQELDLGSNDELFWFWTKQNPQSAILFARHAEFARSPTRTLIPVEPMWLVDALGLPQFESQHRHEGPFPKGNGIVEIRSRIPSPDGEITKLTEVHDRFAWVMKQQVFDVRGRLLASAEASEHEYYPHAQAALPRKVSIDFPPAQLSFQVQTQGYLLNQAMGDSGVLFNLPQDQLPNYPLVNICDPQFQLPVTAPPVNPRVSQALNYRGMR